MVFEAHADDGGGDADDGASSSSCPIPSLPTPPGRRHLASSISGTDAAGGLARGAARADGPVPGAVTPPARRSGGGPLEGGVPGVGGGRRTARAIMETAIAASVGHRHVVRCVVHVPPFSPLPPSSLRLIVLCMRVILSVVECGGPRAQVATYHYDIKRVEDLLSQEEEAEGGCGATGLTPQGFTLAAPPPLHDGGPQAFKVFLVQVRGSGTAGRNMPQASKVFLVQVRACLLRPSSDQGKGAARARRAVPEPHQTRAREQRGRGGLSLSLIRPGQGSSEGEEGCP